MYHYCVIGLVYLLIPHLLKNFIRAEHTPGIGSQKIEDIKFNWRQFNLFPVHYNLVVILVDNQSLDGDLILSRRADIALRV